MASVFRDVIEFLGAIGIYDVILPFLLIFTILFAILEKTRVLGTEDIGGKAYPRRNLNALVAFVVGFLVVASAQLVSVINQAVAHTMVLLVLSVFFMILVGSFYKEGEFDLDSKWKVRGTWIMAIGILLIFLNAIRLRSGVTVLDFIYTYVLRNATGTVVSTILLLAVLVGGMWWIAKPAEEKKS